MAGLKQQELPTDALAATAHSAEDPLVDPLENQDRIIGDLAMSGLHDLLDGPPPLPKRDAVRKKTDLDQATATATRLLELSGDRASVEQLFPSLTRRFGLTRIHWAGEDSDTPTLEIKVNPAASIDAGALVNGDTSHATALTQDVTFTTQALRGDTVGHVMEAKRLGPNHPQGGPPGGALGAVIAGDPSVGHTPLPTDPKLGASHKYIKGHLLNDNIGGPGTAANLFPITALANAEHEQNVEWAVKDWVNNKRGWAYYKVEANIVAQGTDFVDADFVCTFDTLDAAGKRTGNGFKRTIQSRRSALPGVVLQATPAADIGAGSALVDASTDLDKVKLSTANRGETQPLDIPASLLVKINALHTMYSELGMGVEHLVAHMTHLAPGLSDLPRRILFSGDMDYEAAKLRGMINADRGGSIGTWNGAVQLLIRGQDELHTFLDRLGDAAGHAIAQRRAENSAPVQRREAREEMDVVMTGCEFE